ncbi:MAG: LysR family transcriptional regulator [Rubrivivax sp.]|nr:LysR family transcriptional regulator [Rubrivivax sp.]
MDQLRAIRVFLKVVEQGSFAGAARVLDLSPAVVTRLVAELEGHLHTRLLNRSTRSVALTQAGESYAERTRSLLVELDEADAEAQSGSTRVQGHLRVQVPPSFAVHQLARALPHFHAQYPDVSLELVATGPVAGVDDTSDISIIFAGGFEVEGEFVARPLARSELLLCASPEYLARKGRPVRPADLEALDTLIPPIAQARRGITFHRAALADEPRQSITVRPAAPVVSSMQLDAVYAAALAGMGIAGLPSFMAEQPLREGRLTHVLDDWHVATFSLHVGLPSRRHVPARTRAFRDFLLQAYGRDPDADPWLAALGAVPPGLAIGSPGPGFQVARIPS